MLTIAGGILIAVVVLCLIPLLLALLVLAGRGLLLMLGVCCLLLVPVGVWWLAREVVRDPGILIPLTLLAIVIGVPVWREHRAATHTEPKS